MRTVVGAICGYCEMDSELRASKPPSMMTIAITQAKLGRLMKKFDMVYSFTAALLA